MHRPSTGSGSSPTTLREMGLPGFAAKPVEWAIGARIDADWDDLDALAHPKTLQLPILLFHGDRGQVVPISTSDDLAAELPRWVTFYRVPRAGHIEAWNVDPRLYERRLAAFMRQIGVAAPRSRLVASVTDASKFGHGLTLWWPHVPARWVRLTAGFRHRIRPPRRGLRDGRERPPRPPQQGRHQDRPPGRRRQAAGRERFPGGRGRRRPASRCGRGHRHRARRDRGRVRRRGGAAGRRDDRGPDDRGLPGAEGRASRPGRGQQLRRRDLRRRQAGQGAAPQRTRGAAGGRAAGALPPDPGRPAAAEPSLPFLSELAIELDRLAGR